MKWGVYVSFHQSHIMLSCKYMWRYWIENIGSTVIILHLGQKSVHILIIYSFGFKCNFQFDADNAMPMANPDLIAWLSATNIYIAQLFCLLIKKNFMYSVTQLILK